MFATMINTLLAPRYPRRYVGRHRMRFGATVRLTRIVTSRPGLR